MKVLEISILAIKFNISKVSWMKILFSLRFEQNDTLSISYEIF